MAVEAADFIFPKGYLKPAQLGFTLDADLETHIDTAWLDPLIVAVPTATDAMKEAYVCWKAYTAISGAADAQSLGLVMKQVGHAKEEYSDETNPLQMFNDRALACKDEYERLLAVLDTTTDPDEFTVTW